MAAWEDLNAQGRAQKVADEHFRGMSSRYIAHKFKAPEDEIRKYIQIIEASESRKSNFQEYIENTKDRTRDQLRAAQQRKQIAYESLDYARAMEIDRDINGNPIEEIDLETKRPTGKFVMSMRAPTLVPKLLKAIGEADHEIALLEQLIGPKVDVTLQLQMATQTQAIILDALKTLDADKYAQAMRIIEAQQDKFVPQLETLEGVYEEVRDARA